MKPENKQVLDQHEHFYNTFVKLQTISGLSTTAKRDLLRVMREEFWPGYSYDEYCGPCVAKFLKDVYIRYEQWKAANVTTIPEEEVKKIKIRATFPKSKMQ